MIILDILGKPVPWKRVGINTKTGGVYDQQSKEREQYRWQLRSQFVDEPITGPIEIKLLFRMPIPKTIKGRMRKDMLANYVYHTKRPDVDNLEKLILDAMSGIVYADDCQIVMLNACKRYSDKPGITIGICPVSNNIKRQNELEEVYESNFGEDWE